MTPPIPLTKTHEELLKATADETSRLNKAHEDVLCSIDTSHRLLSEARSAIRHADSLMLPRSPSEPTARTKAQQ